MHSCSLQGRFTLKTVIFLTILIHQMKLSTGIKENSICFVDPRIPMFLETYFISISIL